MKTYDLAAEFAGEPTGAGMIFLLSLTGIVVLYLVFKRYRHKLMDVKNPDVNACDAKLSATPNVMENSEEFAAIAIAIHLHHGELQDKEVAVLTIKKVEKPYSPWSSKHHVQNQYFNLKKR